jgi:1-acyl-sn-glycerol-3-phosphate acyltransferase
MYFIVTRGKDSLEIADEDYLRGVKIARVMTRFYYFFLGLNVTERKIDYDYSKWLGKGYEVPEKPNTVISNHCGMMDSCYFLAKWSPMFLAKSELQKIPIWNKFFCLFKFIFVDRNTTKEGRK